jgi:hypothetical protein
MSGGVREKKDNIIMGQDELGLLSFPSKTRPKTMVSSWVFRNHMAVILGRMTPLRTSMRYLFPLACARVHV